MNENRSPKLFVYVAILLAISVVVVTLLVAAYRGAKRNESASDAVPVVRPSITQVENRADTTLTAVVKESDVSVGEEIVIDVMVNTGKNQLTLAQLEMDYDPSVIAITSITAGDFLARPLEYANKIASSSGEITYALGSFEGKSGSGILVQVKAIALKRTEGAIEVLTIKPTTLIAEPKNQQSVLKNRKGATLVIK